MPSKRSRVKDPATWNDYRWSSAPDANSSTTHNTTRRRFHDRDQETRSSPTNELYYSDSQSSTSSSETSTCKNLPHKARSHSEAKTTTATLPTRLLRYLTVLLTAGITLIGIAAASNLTRALLLAPVPARERFGGYIPHSVRLTPHALHERVLDATRSMSHAIAYTRTDVDAVRGLVQHSSAAPFRQEAVGLFNKFIKDAKAVGAALGKFEAKLPQVLRNVLDENTFLYTRMSSELEAGGGKSSAETLRGIVGKSTKDLGTLADQAAGSMRSQLRDMESSLKQIQEIVSREETRVKRQFEEDAEKSLKSGSWSRLGVEGLAQREQHIRSIEEELIRVRTFVGPCQRHVGEVTRRLEKVSQGLHHFHMRQSELVIDQTRPDEFLEMLRKNKEIGAKLERTLKNTDEAKKLEADIHAGVYKGDYFSLPRWVPFQRAK